MNNEMVSIIMPTYNRAYIIERAIKSVLNQTYNNWELIIVDDASTDNTRDIVKRYIDSRIHYFVNDKNRGANAARNFGVENAKGEWIAFLDSDNYWPDYRLAHQLSSIEINKDDKLFLYGKTKITKDDVVTITPNDKLTTVELKKQEILGNVIDMNSILISKLNFLCVGGLDESMPRLQDWEFVLRLLYKYNFETIYYDELYSINEVQADSIGRNTTSYIDAFSSIIKKYMYYNLPKDDMITYLTRIVEDCRTEPEHISEMLSDIGNEHPQLFSYAIKRILKLEKESHNMEDILYQWKNNNILKNKSVFSYYFYEGSKYKTIAIYGLGKLARLFVQEIKGLPVDIKYGIDKEKKIFGDIRVVNLSDNLEKVDLFIVTISCGDEELKDNLKKKGVDNVLTLREMIQSI